jgi:hypothetical protein
MHRSTVRDLFHVALAAALAGCAASGGGSAAISPPASSPSPPGDATRAILEADIIQLDGGKLYAMSKAGSVSIVDVSEPGHLALLGQARIQGEPFEMYRRGDILIAMSNSALDSTGTYTYGPTGTDPGASSQVIALDVADPEAIHTAAALTVPGEIADSRIVGNVLYLASYENAACFQCGPAPRTLVTSFDITDPLAIEQIDQVTFQSNAPDSYNLPWGMHWKRSILATTQRLYIGGHADIDPSSTEVTDEGIIDVLDISDPAGHLGAGARLRTAGAILSRWQLDEQDGILRVISQRGAGRTGNGVAMPEIQTFRIDSTQSFVPLGRTTMTLPRQEGLRTVRFDGARGYAITYNQTDPLFVIDLADPANPRQRGELFMPGFMYYLEPHGDRVIGLGIDRTDPNGSLNVSLFDVSNPDAPAMLARAAFATAQISEDYAILNGEVAEDQDRIQKAFHVFDDGLVVVPFSALRSYSSSGDGCANAGGGVQLVRWADDSLDKLALLPLPGHPRRALEVGDELLAVSDSNVRAFALADPQVANQTADLVIDTCVPDSDTGYDGGGGGGDDPNYEGGDQGGYEYGACAAGRGGTSGAFVIAFALLLARRRRGRR